MASGRPLATTPTPEVEEDPLLLYAPITKQIDPKRIPWTIEYLYVTPEQAQEWLDEADANKEFGQRPRTKARKKRWLSLYQSNRYAFFNPMAPLCFSQKTDVLMNGGNRLAALIEHDQKVGFMVIRNCPVWLMNYFDNGNSRTLRESMFINQRDVKPDTSATVRLGMRYEEFLFGKRKDIGWTDWGRHKDEHIDVDNFISKRDYLLEMLPEARVLAKRCQLQTSSLACFLAYQMLAWPQGQATLEEFTDGLGYGVMLSKGNPALTLREWAVKDGFIGGYTYGRREGHLLLLFKAFLLSCENQKMPEVRVAKGLPMAMPYHPDGWEIACKNVREALIEMG